MLLLIQRRHLMMLLIIRNHLNLLYIRYNLRYIGPQINWEMRIIPSEFVNSKGPLEFKQFFRMKYATFEKLCSQLFNHYTTTIERRTTQGRPSHAFEWKLAVCIRFYARAECLATLKHLFGSCMETVHASSILLHLFEELQVQ